MLKWAILASGLVHLAGLAMHVRVMDYLFKPTTMLLIILFAWQNLQHNPIGRVGLLLLTGLGFSLLGDVFLMLPQDLFLPGLVAFLTAHICYIAAMSAAISRSGGFHFQSGYLLAALLLLLVTGVLFERLSGAMKAQGSGGMLIPVLLYSLVISVMVWTAVAGYLQPGRLPLRQAVLLAAALLFYISDSTLAWGKFVAPLPAQNVLVMVTYFAAQFGFAYSLQPSA